MAVVMPVFFMLVFGLIEFSRAVMIQQTMTDAARAGCRRASLASCNDSGVAEAAARDLLTQVVNDPSTCNVAITPNALSALEPGTEITTTVSTNFSDVSWLAPSFLDGITISATATSLRE
jgi:Flp pilus assembly protein TadG